MKQQRKLDSLSLFYHLHLQTRSLLLSNDDELKLLFEHSLDNDSFPVSHKPPFSKTRLHIQISRNVWKLENQSVLLSHWQMNMGFFGALRSLDSNSRMFQQKVPCLKQFLIHLLWKGYYLYSVFCLDTLQSIIRFKVGIVTGHIAFVQ